MTRHRKRYAIEVWQLSTEAWQADCGNDHARGVDPISAIVRLLNYIEARHGLQRSHHKQGPV